MKFRNWNWNRNLLLEIPLFENFESDRDSGLTLFTRFHQDWGLLTLFTRFFHFHFFDLFSFYSLLPLLFLWPLLPVLPRFPFFSPFPSLRLSLLLLHFLLFPLLYFSASTFYDLSHQLLSVVSANLLSTTLHSTLIAHFFLSRSLDGSQFIHMHS